MDIQQIFQHAKDDMLRDGEHSPSLYVQLAEGGMILVAFADFPYETTLEKQKAFFGLGLKIGQEYRDDEIMEVCFVIEAWMAHQKYGEERQCAPSENPNRREVLTVQVLSVVGKSIKQSMHVAEIIRVGDTIDLAPYESVGEVDNRLLPAFLVGFMGAKLSPQEMSAIMTRAMGK
jgi:hypothetical protein